jgi:hypothetical protein
LRRLAYALVGGTIIGLNGFAILHQHHPDRTVWTYIAVATIGSIVGVAVADFVIIPWLRGHRP